MILTGLALDQKAQTHSPLVDQPEMKPVIKQERKKVSSYLLLGEEEHTQQPG